RNSRKPTATTEFPGDSPGEPTPNPPGNPRRTRRAGRFFRLQWSHPPTEAMTMARTPSSDSRPPRTPRVPAALAGVILSLGMFGVVLGSTVPSGLYSIYQRQMGLPDSITTIVFSFYVVGVVVALVFGGHLSDQI